jgi:hypothetical protein
LCCARAAGTALLVLGDGETVGNSPDGSAAEDVPPAGTETPGRPPPVVAGGRAPVPPEPTPPEPVPPEPVPPEPVPPEPDPPDEADAPIGTDAAELSPVAPLPLALALRCTWPPARAPRWTGTTT